MDWLKKVLFLLLFCSIGCFASAQNCNQLDFSYKVITCTSPYTIQLDADTLNIFPPGTTYQFWQGACNTGAILGQSDPLNIQLPAGNYTICLVATLPNGTKCTVSKNVLIQPTSPPDFTITPNPPICDPAQLVTFTVVGGQNIIKYQWLLPELVNNVTTTSKVFTAGTHNIFLVYTDQNGCTDQISKTIVVHPKLTVNFTANPNEGCVPPPFLTTFTPTISGEVPGQHFVTNYEWTFTGGTPSTSTAQNPSVSFPVGSHTVKLKVTTNTGCVYELTKPDFMKVYQKPIVAISPFPTAGPICTGETLQFTNNTVGGQNCQYTWQGANPNENGAVFSAQNPGTYNVTLTCKQGQNCIATSPPTVVTVVGPTINFSAPIQERAICNPPGVVNFTIADPNNQLAGCTFTWRIYEKAATQPFHVETTTTLNYSYEFPMGDNFYAIEVEANCPGGCSAKVKKDKYVIVVKPIANAVSNKINYCTGDLVKVTSLAEPGGFPLEFEYEISKNGGPFVPWSNEENPSKAINEPGTYVIRQKVSNLGLCPSPWQLDEIVVGGVKAKLVLSPYNICVPGQSTATLEIAENSAPGAVTVSWASEPENGITLPPNGANQFGGVITTQQPAKYKINVKATNSAQCTANIDTILYAGIIPDIKPMATKICKGTPVQIKGSGLINKATGYLWNVTGPGNVSIEPSNTDSMPTFTFNSGGTYTLSLTVSSDSINPPCSSVKKDTTITIIEINPTVSILEPLLYCAPKVGQFTATPNNAVSYTFYYDYPGGDSAITNTNSAAYLYKANGEFEIRVLVTDINGCTELSPPATLTIKGPLPKVVPDRKIICQNESNESSFTIQFSTAGTEADRLVLSYGDGTTDDLTAPFPPIITHVYNNVFFQPDQCVRKFPPQALAYQKVEISPGNFVDCDPQLVNLDTIYYHRKPEAQINYRPEDVTCPPFSVEFKDASKYCPTVWEWDFDNDGTPEYTTPDVVHEFLTGSQGVPFKIRLKVFNDAGCVDDRVISLEIKGRPQADFTSPDPNACSGDVVKFQNLSQGVKDANGNIISGVVKSTWSFGDNSDVHIQNVSGPDPEHIYTNIGKYDVKLIVEAANGCIDTLIASEFVTVTKPKADFTSDPSWPMLRLYPPLVNVQFQDASSPDAVKWDWKFGNGFDDTNRNPLHGFRQIGKFNVQLIVSDQYGCKDTVERGPYEIREFDLNIPNVFTPDGDGMNDRFRITYTGFDPYNLSIYDRWGNIMKENITNPEDGWDGVIESSGKIAPPGVYYYLLKIGEKVKSGNVTLLNPREKK